MYDFCVEYQITEDEANEYGKDMSIGVMESYSCIMDAMEDEVEDLAREEGIAYENLPNQEYEDWMTNALTEIQNENTSWTCYRLRDDLSKEDKDHIQQLDWEEIRDLYAIKD